MKIVEDCDDWFMDATLKIAQKNWYQVFKIFNNCYEIFLRNAITNNFEEIKIRGYFKKNWSNNKYFSISEISDEDIIKRTNNI